MSDRLPALWQCLYRNTPRAAADRASSDDSAASPSNCEEKSHAQQLHYSPRITNVALAFLRSLVMSYRSSSAVGTLCSPASPGTVLSGGSCAGCHDVDDPPEGKKRVGLVVARYVGCIESRAWVTNCDVSSKSLRHSFTTNEYGCGDADVSPFGDDHAGRGVPSIYRYGSDGDVEESRDSECWKVSCRQIEGRLVIDGG